MATDWENNTNPDNKIDMMALQPHFVETKMIGQFKERGETFLVVSTESCVSAALRDLGIELRTYGPYQHEAIAGVSSEVFKYMNLSYML